MKKIIIALDSPSNTENMDIIAKTNDLVWGYKFNNVSLASESTINLCKYLTQIYPIKIFIDLKVYDIPTTLIKTVMEYHEYIDMITVHCSNGPRALKKLMDEKPQCTIVGVTILSSFDVLETHKIYGRGLFDAFEHMLYIAQDAGIKAITVSPNLLRVMNKLDPEHSIERIVPGIRTRGSKLSDHSYTFTPGEAIKAGADYIVLGRTVTESPEPREILKNIIKEINETL